MQLLFVAIKIKGIGMRASYNMLRELIEFELTPEQLAHELTMTGTEVESIIKPSEWISGVVAAKITEIKTNTPREGLSVCTVFDGEKNYQTITGAPDAQKGILVAFAKPGAKIFGEKKIGIIEIDGVKSEGMVCSGVELGLGAPKDRLYHLPPDTKLGEDVARLLGFEDIIFELEITPNRPDCYGHWGLAREIAAITGKPWEPVIPRPRNVLEGFGDLDVEIRTENCPRYAGRLIEGVTVADSPPWLAGKLAMLGMRPINNIVDITNYVMMLTGQPIHAFDADKLGKKIVVRQAGDNETIRTLEGEKRALSREIMVIADDKKPVAIAGVMGGLETEVDESTKNIIVEVAYFKPASVRRARKLLELSTESAIRFERGTDPQAPPVVSDIVAKLAQDIAEAKKIYKTVDIYPTPVEPALVTLTDKKVERLLGVKVPREESRRILVCLGLDIAAENAGGITFRVPTFRPDLTREVDLVEEVARIYKLEKIQPSFKAKGLIHVEVPDIMRLKRLLSDLLVGLGYFDALTDPLGRREIFELFAQKPLVELVNPLSEDLSVMRPNPLPTLIAATARNLNRGMRSVRLFEIDYGYAAKEQYEEELYLALACGGMRNPIAWWSKDEPIDLFDVKGTVESILRKLGIQYHFVEANLPFAEDGTALELIAEGKSVGFVGTLRKNLWEKFELRRDVHFGLVEVGPLLPYFTRVSQYKRFSRFPATRRDVALILDSQVRAQTVLARAKELAKDAEEVGIFDVYEGKPIPAGKKSIGIYFVFRGKDRTLTDEEVNERFRAVVKELCEIFSAEIRK